MTTPKGFVGGIYLERGDGNSPEGFTRVCSVFSISGLGVTNDQVDATTFCSGGFKEYIAGLADGAQITIECNFRADGLTDDVQQQAMRTDVNQKAIRDFRIAADGNLDGVIDRYFYFSGTCLSWVLNPSPSAKNSISFGVKISGAILETVGP